MATDKTKPPLIISISNTGEPFDASDHSQTVANRLLNNPITKALESISGNAWIVFLAAAGTVLLMATLAGKVK